MGQTRSSVLALSSVGAWVPSVQADPPHSALPQWGSARCSELLHALQEKHAEEQAGGHGQEEVQHGSQEGTVGWGAGLVTCLWGCARLYHLPVQVAGAGAEPAARAGAGGGSHRPPSISLAPLQGIQFLIENDLLKNTCEDIAQFLYKGEGLNKTAIGDYLGER